MAKRGGPRPGAGRKRHPRPPVEVHKAVATRVLAAPPDKKQGWLGEFGAWMEQLTAKHKDGRPDYHTRFRALEYLTNKRDGKPVQPISGPSQGPIEIADVSAVHAKLVAILAG